MKYILLIIFSAIQFCCIAQTKKIKSKKVNYQKYENQEAYFTSTNDSLFLNYKYSSASFKPNKEQGYEYIKELSILIPIDSIQINISDSIPNSIIIVVGTYWILGNWYLGHIQYDSYQGQLTFLKIKKHSIKINIYLVGKTGSTKTILVNNKHLLFRKEKLL
jgi:hypothetical protein